MPRIQRLAAGFVIGFLILAGFILPRGGPTAVLAGSGTVSGGGSGGGFGSGSSGGGAVTGHGDCGASGTLIVYDGSLWGHPHLNGADFNPWVSAYSYDDTVSGPNNHEVFVIDSSTGYAYGSPLLHAYHLHNGQGEGLPPQWAAPLWNGDHGGFNNNVHWPGYEGWYNCYPGDVIGVSQPLDFSWDLHYPDGTAAVNSPLAVAVGDMIVAKTKKDCVLAGVAGAGTGMALPPPPWPDDTITYRKDPQCPWSAVDRGSNNEYIWQVYAQPVLQQDRADCAGGSGAYRWTWEPSSYTHRNGFCTTAPTDTTRFFWVHDCGNPPGSCTSYPFSPPRNNPNAGLTVSLTVLWREWCSGTIHLIDPAHDFVFLGSYTTETQTWSRSVPQPPPDPPIVETYTATLTCDVTPAPGHVQQYDSTFEAPVQQIESLAD